MWLLMSHSIYGKAYSGSRNSLTADTSQVDIVNLCTLQSVILGLVQHMHAGLLLSVSQQFCFLNKNTYGLSQKPHNCHHI